MKTKLAAIGVAIVVFVTRAAAHQLDEYLQATLLAVEKTAIKADMYLTPGVAVLPAVLAEIDSDRDGVVSPAEQRAYAARVLRDLSLTLNGATLTLRLASVEFPKPGEMKEGRGDIHLEFSAALPKNFAARKLRLENHHQSGIAAYQVNCLVPPDPAIRIGAEHRNYSQSVYELEFTRTDDPSVSPRFPPALATSGYLGASVGLLSFGLVLRRFRRGWRLAHYFSRPKVG